MTQKPWNILMVVLSTVAPDVRVEKEARFLSEQGHQVTVIGIDKTGKLSKKEKRDGYTILRVPSTKRIFFKYFEFWKNVRKMISKQKYDIIHFCLSNKIPIDLTYSCLVQNSPPCGKCGGCKDRRLINEIERFM